METRDDHLYMRCASQQIPPKTDSLETLQKTKSKSKTNQKSNPNY